jgi:hypothetical protein
MARGVLEAAENQRRFPGDVPSRIEHFCSGFSWEEPGARRKHSFGCMAFSKSDLAKTDQRVARARERLERQRELIRALLEGGHDTNDAEALFRTMRRTLEHFEEDRRLIEDELFKAKAGWA